MGFKNERQQSKEGEDTLRLGVSEAEKARGDEGGDKRGGEKRGRKTKQRRRATNRR